MLFLEYLIKFGVLWYSFLLQLFVVVRWQGFSSAKLFGSSFYEERQSFVQRSFAPLHFCG